MYLLPLSDAGSRTTSESSTVVSFQGPGITSISLASPSYHDDNLTSSVIFGPKTSLPESRRKLSPCLQKLFLRRTLASSVYWKTETNDISNWLRLHLAHPSRWITRRRAGMRQVSSPGSAGRARRCLTKTRQFLALRSDMPGAFFWIQYELVPWQKFPCQSKRACRRRVFNQVGSIGEPPLREAYLSSAPLLLPRIHQRCSIGHLRSTRYLSSPRPAPTDL